MIPELIPIGSHDHVIFFFLLLVCRGMDFLSTWIATPNLILEANPIARRLGWRWGIPLNVALCVSFALMPLPAVIISTTSVLVAARNFQSAWLMRSLGEGTYQLWMRERLEETSFGLFLFCLFAQSILVGAVGGCLVWFSGLTLVPLGVGLGLIAYSIAVLLYSLISVWRNRHAAR